MSNCLQWISIHFYFTNIPVYQCCIIYYINVFLYNL
jgi:hypothetical protein